MLRANERDYKSHPALIAMTPGPLQLEIRVG
jgi:hypothetical protein